MQVEEGWIGGGEPNEDPTSEYCKTDEDYGFHTLLLMRLTVFRMLQKFFVQCVKDCRE